MSFMGLLSKISINEGYDACCMTLQREKKENSVRCNSDGTRTITKIFKERVLRWLIITMFQSSEDGNLQQNKIQNFRQKLISYSTTKLYGH